MSDDDDRTYVNDEHEKASSSDDEDAKQSENKSRVRSIVWNYFDRVGEQNVGLCRYCDASLSYRGSVSNLRSHLRRRHPKVYQKLLRDTAGTKEASDPKSKVLILQDGGGQVREIVVRTTDPEPPTRARSSIWRWFQRHEKYKATCRVCSSTLSYMSTTSNLKMHLKRKHPSHFKQLLALLQDIEMKKTIKEEMEKNGIVTEEGIEDIGDATLDTCNCDVDLTEDGSSHKEGCPQATVPSSWDYFDKIDLDSARCRICERDISWSADVNDLRRHLKAEHPDVQIKDHEIHDESEPQTQNPHEVLLEEYEVDVPETRTKVSKPVNPKKDDTEDWNASLDRFGLYVASLMRLLPRETAAKYQVQIIERLMKEKMRCER